MSKESFFKIRFTKDFAGNWSKDDVVIARTLADGEILVDEVAKISPDILWQHAMKVPNHVPTYMH